jgi:hypothetical protein
VIGQQSRREILDEPAEWNLLLSCEKKLNGANAAEGLHFGQSFLGSYAAAP